MWLPDLFRRRNGSARPAGQPSPARVRDSERLTAREREFLPHLLEIVETPPSPYQRSVLWVIMALVLVSAIWATVGQISIVSSVQGKFVPDGHVKQIQPLETSVVKSILVQEGQHVHAGDVLLELDPTIDAAELEASSNQLQLNHLEQQRLQAELGGATPRYDHVDKSDSALITLQESLRHSRDDAYHAKMAAAQSDADGKASALAAAESTRHKLEELTRLAQQREADARPLLSSGAIARVDYMQLQQDLLTNQNDLASQIKLVQQAGEACAQARHELDELRHLHSADIYNDLNQKIDAASSLQGSVDKSQRLLSLKWLRSPVDGLVQRVDVTTTGGVVTPAQSLVTIVPDGTPLIVEATLSNEDVGYVKAGQPVEIKVDTFPFQKYGVLKGTLTWVSPDAEDKNQGSDNANGTGSGSAAGNGSGTGASGKGGYSYKVHIRPERMQLTVKGLPTPIQAGMTVQADITTDHRRIIDFFLSPMIKYLDEGLKVR